MSVTQSLSVCLQGSDAAGDPLITVCFVCREEMRQAIRLSREVFAMPAFDRFRGDEILPGEASVEQQVSMLSR